MRLFACLAATALFPFLLCAQEAPDEAVWDEFVKWSASLKPLPPGERGDALDLYLKYLGERGVPAAEARRRFDRVGVLRRGSTEREKVYWDAAFKLGGGPSDPLRLLQETVRKRKPGKALDSAMGRGRNGIWLASTGWDVTGYDISTDALAVARAYAEKAGATLKMIESSHEKFDFGENQWDLILCSYNFMNIADPKWPEVFFKALKPDGLVVWQTFTESNDPALGRRILELWKQYHLVRFEDLEAGVVDDDWMPSRRFRTFRLVVRK